MRLQRTLFTSRLFLRPLLQHLVSTFGLSLLMVFPLAAAGAESSLSSQAVTSSGLVLDGARSSKLKAESYQDVRDLNNATFIWVKAAKAYGQAGVFGEAALAWTEAASLHEQENALQGQVQALIHWGYALQQVGQHLKAIVAFQAARPIAEQGHDTGLLVASLGQFGRASVALSKDGIAVKFCAF